MFSLLRKWQRHFRSTSPRPVPLRPKGWPREPLSLLVLEDRLTPATLHWTGAASSNWSATGNWAEGVAPVSGDTLVFDTTTPNFAATTAAFAPNDDIGGLTNLSLVINDASSAGDFSITGDSFGLAPSGVAIASTQSVGSNVTIANNLTLGANTTIDVGLGTLTLNGIIGGAFTLNADSAPAGTLVLSGNNTYAGGTTLTSGTLAVNNNNALGTGTLELDGGNLGEINAFYDVPNSFVVNTASSIDGGAFFTMTGNGVLNANLTVGSLTFTGVLSGSGGLIENAFPGNTYLYGTAANTFTGGVTIIAGDVYLGKTAGVAAIASGEITLGGGAFPTLTWQASNQLNDSVSIDSLGSLDLGGYSDTVGGLSGNGQIVTGSTATAGLTVTGAGSNVVTGTVTGSGLLTYNGTGSLTLAGASSSYTGTLTAEQGALIVAANFSGATATSTSGGTLTGTGIVGTLSAGTGTITPGADGSGGILSTAGASNASALAGETFQADLNDLGPAGQLVVGNGATLNLTNATLSAALQHSTAGDVFTIVSSATGGISGTFVGLPNDTRFVVGHRMFLIQYTADAVTVTDVQTITLTPATLLPAEVGLAYNQSITSTGGTGAVALTLSNVAAVAGLTVTGSGTGTITVSGTPTATGTVTFTVTPSDSNGAQAGQTYSFTVAPAVVLTPATLPADDVGHAYSQTITSTGGTGTVTLNVTNVQNAIPGLTVTGSGSGTITISGTPTATGTESFTVTPTDGVGTGTPESYSFTVNPAVALTPTTLPTGEAGLAYSQTITSTGGTGTVTLNVTNVQNAIPGLTITGTGSGTITITGTPTATGTESFTVTPTDSIGTGTPESYSITVGPAVVLTPTTLPAGELGVTYSQSITPTGGTGTVTLAVSNVTAVAGLTITGTGSGTITISGTPTATGTESFTVTPTDASGTEAPENYSFVVGPAIFLTPLSLPTGEIGQSYDQSITSTGGSGTVTLAVSNVTSVAELTITGSGTGTITVTGTPTSSGTVTFMVTPTDSVGPGTGKLYSFAVNPAAALTPTTLPAGEVTQAYNQSITPTGGVGAVSLAVSGVTNPTGLTISGSGTGSITISGTPTDSGTVTFTVTPTDSLGTGSAITYSFVVFAKPLVAAATAGAGSGTVSVYDPLSGALVARFQPFGAYSGGVQVAVGDTTGDGYDDLIVMAGPGALNGLVQIYSGKDFSLLSEYYAFPGYQGAFNIAAGDLTGNGVDDVIFSTATGADFVFAYAGDTNNFIVSPFSAFGGFTGGVTVAAGDLTGVGHDEIIVGTASLVGAAGVFNQFGQLLQPYYFAPIPMNGVNVAAGDLNDSGHDDLIFGAKNSTLVLTYDGESQGLMGYFFALPGQSYGVTVAAVDPTGDGYADIVTGFTGNVSAIALFTGLSFQLTDVYGQPSGAGGVNVAGGA